MCIQKSCVELIRIIKNAYGKFDKLFDESIIDDAVEIIRKEQINMKIMKGDDE